jgi:hypothetical protein
MDADNQPRDIVYFLKIAISGDARIGLNPNPAQ